MIYIFSILNLDICVNIFLESVLGEMFICPIFEVTYLGSLNQKNIFLLICCLRSVII